MSKLSVFIATSLDGFIARPDGAIDWFESANAAVPAGLRNQAVWRSTVGHGSVHVVIQSLCVRICSESLCCIDNCLTLQQYVAIEISPSTAS